MKPLVSIIVPFFNTGVLLERSIRAFINQSYENIEIVLINDGSTDNSLNIAKELTKSDDRVKIVSQENKGVSTARNVGMEVAKGKYFYFPDSDDSIELDTIEKLVEGIQKFDADLVICGYAWVDRQGNNVEVKTYKLKKISADYIRTNFDEFILRESEYGIYGSMANKLYKSEIINDNNLTVPVITFGEDEMFNMKYLTVIKSVCYIEDVLYYYYRSGIKGKSKKYLDNFVDKIVMYKDFQMDVVYGFNKGNKKVLEEICRNFAVRFDLYLQMCMFSLPWYSVSYKYRKFKHAVDVFNKEIPSREFEPDFKKYKFMLNRNIVRLYIVEIIKVWQMKIRERKLL